MQFFNYARGDGQALYFRPQTPFIFVRYIAGIALIIAAFTTKSHTLVYAIMGLLALYCVWAIQKNYRYVRLTNAFVFLPTLQVVSDIAVMLGTCVGLLQHPVFNNTGIQLMGRLITASSGFVMTALLARYLGPQGFGSFSFVFAVSTAVFMAADLGLDTYLTRASVQKTEKNAFTTVFSLRVYLACVLMILLIGYLSFSGYSGGIKRGILIASLSSITLLLSNTLWSVFKGQLRYKVIVTAQVMTSATIVILFWFGLLQKLELQYFIIAYVVGYGCGLIFSLACWDRPYKQFTLVSRHIRSLLIDFLPFIAIYLFATAYFKIDVLLLGFFFSPQHSPVVGYYSLAYKPFEIAIVLGGYFTQTLLPYFSVERGIFLQKSRTFFRNVTFFVALCVFVGLYLCAPLYIYIIGGSEYQAALIPLQILSVAAAITIMSGYYASSLLAYHQEKSIVWISIVAFCVNIGANVILIPRYSYLAASWTTVLTQCIVLIGYLFVSARNNAQTN